MEGEKRLRDVWEKIKEQTVSGGVETIIGQVNTHTHTHTLSKDLKKLATEFSSQSIF